MQTDEFLKVGNEYEKGVEQASFYGGLRTDCSLESSLGAWHSGRPHQSCWCQLGLASPAFVSDPSDNQPSQLDYTAEYDVTPTRKRAAVNIPWRRWVFLLSVSQILRRAMGAGVLLRAQDLPQNCLVLGPQPLSASAVCSLEQRRILFHCKWMTAGLPTQLWCWPPHASLASPAGSSSSYNGGSNMHL